MHVQIYLQCVEIPEVWVPNSKSAVTMTNDRCLDTTNGKQNQYMFLLVTMLNSGIFVEPAIKQKLLLIIAVHPSHSMVCCSDLTSTLP